MTRKNICEAVLTYFLNFKHLYPDPHSKYGSGFSNSNQYGSGSTFSIWIRIQQPKSIRIQTRIQNMDPDLSINSKTNKDPEPQSGNKGTASIFMNQRSTLRKLSVQCSYIIGSQKLNTSRSRQLLQLFVFYK